MISRLRTIPTRIRKKCRHRKVCVIPPTFVMALTTIWMARPLLPSTNLCPLLNAFMLTGTRCTRLAANPQKVPRGAGLDLNNDGKIDLEDLKLAASGIEEDFKLAASGIVETMDADGDGNIDLHDVQQLTQGVVGQVRRKGLLTLIRELPFSAKLTIVRRCVKSVIIDHPGGIRGKVQGARRLMFLVFGNIKQADASKMLLTNDDAKIVEIIVEVVGNNFSKTATAMDLDVNGDGSFDGEDMAKMLKEAMDMDGDGQVDASDALKAMNQWFDGLTGKSEDRH